LSKTRVEAQSIAAFKGLLGPRFQGNLQEANNMAAKKKAKKKKK